MPPKESKRATIPTQAEIDRVLQFACDSVKRAVTLVYYTGARPGPSEAFSLTWDDVDFENETITVRGADKGGRKNRQIPIHDSFMPTLRGWCAKDGRAGRIINHQGRAIDSCRMGFAKAKKQAGVKFRLYDLRHNFATRLIANGVDVVTVAALLGHSVEVCLKTYAHVIDSNKRAAIQNLGAVGEKRESNVVHVDFRKVNS
jgi:integrase